MEFVFRRHFWMVHAVFVLLAGILVGRGVSTYIESALLPAPTAAATAASAPAIPRTPWGALNPKSLSEVTGLALPVEPSVVEPQQPVVDLNAAPVKSGLRVRLLGTLLSGVPEWSFASIQDMSTQKATSYMRGEAVLGAQILEIERTRVVVLNNNRREYIDGTPGDGASAPPAYAPPPVPPPTAATTGGPANPVQLGAGIKQVSDNDYEVPKDEIDRTLSNLNQVAMEARIVPAFKDGAAQGFKLFSIRPDSFYSKLGIQNGDVIRRINGYDLNSPERALEVYSKLKESRRIDIELDRNGAAVRKTYNVR